MYINNLPNAEKLKIFEFLPIKDIAKIMILDKENKKILDDNIFWNMLYKREFGLAMLSNIKNKTSKEIFKETLEFTKKLIKKANIKNFIDVLKEAGNLKDYIFLKIINKCCKSANDFGIMIDDLNLNEFDNLTKKVAEYCTSDKKIDALCKSTINFFHMFLILKPNKFDNLAEKVAKYYCTSDKKIDALCKDTSDFHIMIRILNLNEFDNLTKKVAEYCTSDKKIDALCKSTDDFGRMISILKSYKFDNLAKKVAVHQENYEKAEKTNKGIKFFSNDEVNTYGENARTALLPVKNKCCCCCKIQ